MPDIVAEAAAFYNETGRDPEFDLSLPLVWAYVLGPLKRDQIRPVKARLRQHGFSNLQAGPQAGTWTRFLLWFSETRVHTADSYAERIRELAELAGQHGLELTDWSVENLPEADTAGDEQPADPLAPRLVESFVFPFQADVARFRLELEGIPTRLASEMMAGWCWDYSNVVGGVKLLVRAKDVPRAVEILDYEAEMAAAAQPFEAGQTAAPGGGFPPPRLPRRWACPRCAARVPNDFCVCWACGTTADGQTDPKFRAVDAPAVESDRLGAPAFWAALISIVYLLFVLKWPAALLLFLPMAAYELLSYVLPEPAAERRKRPATFVPLDPRLRRACMLAVFADGVWPIPFSLWLLGKVGWRRDAQRRRQNRFFVLALTIDLVCLVLMGAVFLSIFLR